MQGLAITAAEKHTLMLLFLRVCLRQLLCKVKLSLLQKTHLNVNFSKSMAKQITMQGKAITAAEKHTLM